MDRTKKNMGGFTLIEMLLVVAVLAIVGGMIVTQFGDTEENAKAVAAVHNPDTLEQTINDFDSLYGTWPIKWHTGLSSSTSVEGLGLQVALNMAADDSGDVADDSIANNFSRGYQVLTLGDNVNALTTEQIRALRDHGVHSLTNDGYTPVSNPDSVPTTRNVDSDLVAWVLTGGKDLFRRGTATLDEDFNTIYTLGTEVVTIDGRTLASWNGFGSEAVVLVACTRDVNWKSILKGDPDETSSFGSFIGNSQIELVEPPIDPEAQKESQFPYYWAAFYLSPDNIGGPGFSGDLLGILDSELQPVRS